MRAICGTHLDEGELVIGETVVEALIGNAVDMEVGAAAVLSRVVVSDSANGHIGIDPNGPGTGV